MFLIAAALLAATPATLNTVITSARAGDTVRLAPGTYPQLKMYNREWNPPVVVEADGATLPFVGFYNSTGLVWRGGSIVGVGTGPYGEGWGFYLVGSRNVTITGMNVSNVKNGMVVDRSSDVTLRNNAFDRMSADGIDVLLSRRVVVDGTRCRNFVSFPGSHPDCIQAWSRPSAPPVADLTIINTDVLGRMQGIGLFDHVRDGIPDGGFDRVTIRNNKILNTMAQGIAVSNCRACVVRDNEVNSLPNFENRAQLNIYGGSVQACGNVVPMVPRQATPPCPR